MIYTKIVTEAKHCLYANPAIRSKAKELRRKLTPSEKILWKCLRSNKMKGMYFRRQHPYGIYILDFYCFKAKLAIEVDGPVHLKRREYDVERTRYIESTGVSVLRFKNEDVENRLEWVLETILRKVTES